MHMIIHTDISETRIHENINERQEFMNINS